MYLHTDISSHMHACIYTFMYTFAHPPPHPPPHPPSHPPLTLNALLFSGEAVLMILQKDNAIKAWREFMGPTNSLTVHKP
jgi:hypothetical protein